MTGFTPRKPSLDSASNRTQSPAQTTIPMNFKPGPLSCVQTIFPGAWLLGKRMLTLAPLLAAVLMIPSCNLIGAALGLGVAKLQFGCLPEGTLIDTPQGSVRIETLESGDAIIGFSGEPVRINQIHQYREDPATSRYLTLHFDNGQSISTSPMHRIDGVPASRLEIGDVCGSCKVTRIQNRRGVSRSFDLLTEDAGYRIAGIPVNSMIGEMTDYAKVKQKSAGPN